MTPEQAAERVLVAHDILEELAPYNLHTADWVERDHPERAKAVNMIGAICQKLKLIHFALINPERSEINKTLGGDS